MTVSICPYFCFRRLFGFIFCPFVW